MNKSQKSIFVDCHVFDASAQGTTTYLKGIYLELIKDKEINFYLASFYRIIYCPFLVNMTTSFILNILQKINIKDCL